MHHTMKLAETPYRKIEMGLKTIESRLFDEKRQSLNLGDTIQFQCSSDLSSKCTTKVIALLRYPSFEMLMNDFPASAFGGENTRELLEGIHTYYTSQEEEQFGVLGIKIKLL